MPPPVRTPSIPRQTVGLVQQVRKYEPVVRQVAQDGWQTTANDYFADVATEQTWRAIDRHWKPTNCADLADIAQRLEALAKPLTFVDSFVNGVTGEPLLGKLAVSVIQVCNPLTNHVYAAAKLLRGAGILECFLKGELENCRCLKDVLDSKGRVWFKTLFLRGWLQETEHEMRQQLTARV